MPWSEYAHTAQTELENRPLLKIKNGSGQYIPVGDIYSMPPPIGFQTTLIEMTHLATPGGAREYKAARPEPVQLSITLGYSLESEGLQAIRAAKGQVADFEVSYSGSTLVHTFQAVVMSFTPSDIAVGGRWEGTLVLQITGEVQEGTAS